MVSSYFGLNHPKNGIVHVIGPELGYTLPGMTIVCGDSHTSTHGAFRNNSIWNRNKRGGNGACNTMHTPAKTKKDEDHCKRQSSKRGHFKRYHTCI